MMDQDVVRNHASISSAAEAFLDYAITEGNCLEPAALLGGDLPPLFRNYRYPLHSWPWFLGEEMRKTLEGCVRFVPSLVQRAIKVEFGNDAGRLAAFFGMGDMLAHLYMESTLDLSHLMFRVDAVLTATGLKVMEINAGSDIGGWQIQWMDGQYRNHPSLQAFFAKIECESRNTPLGYLKHIITIAMAVRDRPDEEIHVFIVVDPEFMAIDDSANTISKVFQDALTVCDCDGSVQFGHGYDGLTFSSSGVHLGGKRISAVVSSHQRADLPIPQMLFRAYLANRVAWPDNPFAATIGDKRCLALLHRHKDSAAFSAEERRLIEYFVPWSTEAMPGMMSFEGRRIELEQLLVAERARFVIKIARGARGDDVYVGKHKTADEWVPIVRRALSESGWLVQEFCASLPFYGQLGESGYGLHDVIWGVFGFGGQYGGCWLRLMGKDSRDGIINSAKGAQETIVYEIVDRAPPTSSLLAQPA